MTGFFILISLVAGFVTGLLCMSHINSENMSKEDYMAAIQMVCNDHGLSLYETRRIIEELNNYAGSIDVEYEYLSKDAKMIVDKINALP